MKVYEVLADWDGTLRSRAYSEGLFATKKAAEDYARSLLAGGKCYGGASVKERQVHGNFDAGDMEVDDEV